MTTTEMTPLSAAQRTGTINIHDSAISVWEERVDEPGMRLVFRAMLARLRSRGWKIERDPDAVKNYPTLADRKWTGRRGDLEVHAETFGRTAKAEFFQNVANVHNRNGGRYDFDKMKRMPRHMRVLCIVELAAMTHLLRGKGYAFGDKIAKDGPLLRVVRDAAEGRMGELSPLEWFNHGWGADRFKRDERGWPAPEEYAYYVGANHDRNGVPLRPMEVRYFRHWNGRLLRGLVFPDMNQMWAVHYGGEIAQVNRGELFLCERPDLEPRRLKKGQEKRVRAELEKALSGNDYARVEALARICKALGSAT